MKKVMLCSLSIFLFYACKLVQTNNNGSNELSTQVFPNKVGNYWVYVYNPGIDNNGNPAKITIRVIGQAKLPNGESAMLWKYEFPNYIDTLWVVSNDSLAKFYDKPCLKCLNPMPELKLEIRFPLQTGRYWFTDKAFGDTTRVIDQTHLKVPAGTFDNVYKISKTIGYVTNSVTLDTLWFRNNIGIIQKRQFELDLGPVTGNGLWHLENYKVQ